MRLAGKKVLCLVDEEFEDLELWYPIYRVQEEGAVVHLAGPVSGKSYTGKYGVPAKADFAFADINIDEYDGLLVPGGWAPDKLRRYPEVLAFVRRMNERKADRTDLPRRMGFDLRKNPGWPQGYLDARHSRRYGKRWRDLAG